MLDDTICALATAPGEAGIAIIRISGPEAEKMLAKVFKHKSDTLIPRRLTLGSIHGPEGEALDEVLAVMMPGPHSYTGEDVAEIQCHGGFMAAHEILRLLYAAGCRAAGAGEFTRRAFVNGRLSLSQAEAVMDVIGAKSAAALKIAERQLDGALHREVAAEADRLLDMMAQLELAADYPEEAGDIMERLQPETQLAECLATVSRLLNSANSGRIYREGLATVIVGPVNAGKSTLLNALLATDRAIVTDIPGTTRDTIEEYYNLDGLPLKLVDTAGLRETDDVVEAAGIARSRKFLQKADLVLAVFDAAALDDATITEWQELLKDAGDKAVIAALNKCDLGTAAAGLKEKVAAAFNCEVIELSARDGAGLEELKNLIKSSAGVQNAAELSGLLNSRHQAALANAKNALTAALEAAQADIPADLYSVDIEEARQSLGEISGQTAAEDIIDRVFERFCLGK